MALISDFYISTMLLNFLVQKWHISSFDNLFLKNNKENIALLEKGDLESVISKIDQFPSSFDVKQIVDDQGLLEINIFIKHNTNKFLQQAINNFFDNRNKFKVNLFTCDENICSHKFTNSFSMIEHQHFYKTPKIKENLILSEIIK